MQPKSLGLFVVIFYPFFSGGADGRLGCSSITFAENAAEFKLNPS